MAAMRWTLPLLIGGLLAACICAVEGYRRLGVPRPHAVPRQMEPHVAVGIPAPAPMTHSEVAPVQHALVLDAANVGPAAADLVLAAPVATGVAEQTVGTASAPVDPGSAMGAPLEAPPVQEHESATLLRELVADGSPEAYLEIVRMVNTLPEGSARRAALVLIPQLENPESVGLLFETVRVSGDPELVQAAQMTLGSMTNTAVLWLALALYRGAAEAGQQARMLGVLRQARQSSFVSPLMAIAEQESADGDMLLYEAAIDTLGVIGTTESVQYLAQQIEQAANMGGDGGLYAAALGRVMQPSALPALLDIAAGTGKPLHLETRLAAIRALGHYNWHDVGAVLDQLLQTASDPALLQVVQTAARLAQGNYPDDFSDEP